MLKEGPTGSIVNSGTDGTGIDSAKVGLTIVRLRFEIAVIRIMNNEILLFMLFILTFGIDFHYKASRKSCLTKPSQSFYT
jgi:hypothetical protein